MESARRRIATETAKLSAELPGEVLDAAAEAMLQAADLESARRSVAGAVAHSPYRRAIDAFLVKCNQGPVMEPSAVAAALLTAAACERANRSRQEIEVVWTGPDSDTVPFRRTEQVILQILDSARERVTLVSYAVYAIPRVRQALVGAAARGVQINVVLETPDRLSSENEYSTLRAMGPEVANCSRVYYWPIEKRQKVGQKIGILHVKCVIGDGRWLFVTSANLTDYAFSINMELGVLLTGGSLPRETAALFDGLIASGTLASI